jgi:hypothetical protein
VQDGKDEDVVLAGVVEDAPTVGADFPQAVFVDFGDGLAQVGKAVQGIGLADDSLATDLALSGASLAMSSWMALRSARALGVQITTARSRARSPRREFPFLPPRPSVHGESC